MTRTPVPDFGSVEKGTINQKQFFQTFAEGARAPASRMSCPMCSGSGTRVYAPSQKRTPCQTCSGKAHVNSETWRIHPADMGPRDPSYHPYDYATVRG